MDELDVPVEDWELLDEIDKAQLTLLYALQMEVQKLAQAVEQLMQITQAPRETVMVARDGKTLKAVSKPKI